MKKGELTSTQIILLVLSIIGFLVVIFFLAGLNLGWFSNQELCRLSVLSRATSPESAQGYIPLKCTTKKVCLTEGGDCSNDFAGEKIEKVKIDAGSGVDSARKIEEEIANSMWDCWNAMGQGKLSLFSQGASEPLGFTSSDLVCVICTRISFDVAKNNEEKLFGKVEGTSFVKGEVDVNRYMKENQIPGGSLTYLQAFTDRSVSSYQAVTPQMIAEQQGKIDESLSGGDSKEVGDVFRSDAREMAIVFSQVRPKGYGEVLGNLGKVGAITVGGTFMTPGIGRIAGGIITNPYGLAVATVAAGGVVAYSMSNVYQGRATSAGYCGEFAGSDAKAREKGCSVVQVVPYEPETINKICHVIDGNP